MQEKVDMHRYKKKYSNILFFLYLQGLEEWWILKLHNAI